ncbi:MAG: hypothetical protein E6789_05630, partial [Clostridium baratii]|nr:hypothetical protein [Clostridium baratii]
IPSIPSIDADIGNLPVIFNTSLITLIGNCILTLSPSSLKTLIFKNLPSYLLGVIVSVFFDVFSKASIKSFALSAEILPSSTILILS